MTTARLIICSPNGADIAVLADGAVIQPGPRLRCDAAQGPVQFLLDGKEIRVENAPPFCPAGDSNGVPAPLDLTPGSHTLVAIAWMTPNAIASAQFSIVSPTPTPTPTPTPIPTPTPTPTPTPPGGRVVQVSPGQSIQAALDIAGTMGNVTIALQRGGRYGGGLTIRNGDNLTLAPFGDPNLGAPLIVPTADGTGLSVPRGARLRNLTIRDIAFRPIDRVPDLPGFRLTSKGDGISIMGRVDGLTMDRVDVAYFRQNIAIDDDDGNQPSCSDVIITGLRTSFAWAVAEPGNENKYLGQGLYLSCSRGPITITGSVFYHCGWHEQLPPRVRTPFRHGLYCQKSSARPVITDCGFIDNAAFGSEIRPGGTAAGCYWQGNAFPACAFKPNWSVKGSANVATGGRQWDGSGWMGNGGFYSWADVLNLSDTVEIYVQQTPPDRLKKEYDAAAFTLSNSYTAHPDWASDNPKMTAAGVIVCGHKQLADFPGKNEPASIPGVTVRPAAPVAPAWVASAGPDLLSGKTTVADLIRQAKALAAA